MIPGRPTPLYRKLWAAWRLAGFADRASFVVFVACIVGALVSAAVAWRFDGVILAVIAAGEAARVARAEVEALSWRHLAVKMKRWPKRKAGA